MKALYGLSGDPPTKGHEWVINEIAKVADEINIALAVNPEKNYYFDTPQRAEMLRTIITHPVKIHTISNEFLVRFAKKIGATHLVRGIRSVKDYEFERAMAQANLKLEPSITTWFLLTPPNLEEVSSSFVKSLIGLEGWEKVATEYVHPFVLQKLIDKHQPKYKGLLHAH